MIFSLRSQNFAACPCKRLRSFLIVWETRLTTKVNNILAICQQDTSIRWKSSSRRCPGPAIICLKLWRGEELMMKLNYQTFITAKTGSSCGTPLANSYTGSWGFTTTQMRKLCWLDYLSWISFSDIIGFNGGSVSYATVVVQLKHWVYWNRRWAFVHTDNSWQHGRLH